MKTVDILAFGAHPDDVELGCGGSIALAISQGKHVAIIDLTRGELGTRGTVETRKKEATEAAAILGVHHRENMGFKDGFFKNDTSHKMALIQKIRTFRPQVVFCNTFEDRHIDHGRGNQLVSEACFLSGLSKIETKADNGDIQVAWRPKLILEYIQWNEVKPDIVFDISAHLETKLKAVKAFETQFFDPGSKEAETPISSQNFLDSIVYRAKNFGRLIGKDAGEGFTSKQTLSVDNIEALIS
ncbi:MAG: bacillithiol biosynthesis deacetylase BshB1 [Flavobacteriaceae bacterium]